MSENSAPEEIPASESVCANCLHSVERDVSQEGIEPPFFPDVPLACMRFPPVIVARPHDTLIAQTPVDRTASCGEFRSRW